MKSLVELLEYLLQDCGRRSTAPVRRDVLTLRARVEHEGDSFITITLPTFCADFERSLRDGRIGPDFFRFFKTGKGGTPEFLRGFLSKVFDSDGALLPEPSVDCIRSIRQICLFGKKILRPCSNERIKDAIEGYKKCDDEVASHESGTQLRRYFKLVGDILCRQLRLDDRDILSRIRPSHGPGQTQERVSGNQKWLFRTWHNRLEDVGFTYAYMALPSRVWACRLRKDEWPSFLDPGQEEPVRVVLVPKTLKAPRIIAVEPVCMQYIQQGLLRWLVGRVENRPLTRGHVNFTDQTVNQALAKIGSAGGGYATVDMSEASDRVSLSHVQDMLASAPVLLDLVLACRSTRARTPDGEIISLKKFASMGSALCFPMEALVFFTSIIASRVLRAGLFPTTHNVRSLARDVFVFGDDLIMPQDEAVAICADLESLGLKVNWRKSFWSGNFRESCGSDCYDGELVTPVYQRRDLPTSRRDVAGLLSCLSTGNQLFHAGYVQTATAIREAVTRVFGQLPKVPHDSPAIGWHWNSDLVLRRRWNSNLQRPENLCLVASTPSDPDPLEGLGALAKCYRFIGIPMRMDSGHLATSPRPYGLALKRR